MKWAEMDSKEAPENVTSETTNTPWSSALEASEWAETLGEYISLFVIIIIIAKYWFTF